MFLSEYVYRMAEPQRKKIKLTLKKKNKEEAHAWANAYENNALKTGKTNPVHVTKALVNRELTGKLPRKEVKMGMYKQRIKPHKEQLKETKEEIKQFPFIKRTGLMANKYFPMKRALKERIEDEKPGGTRKQRMSRFESISRPERFPKSLQPFMPELKEHAKTLHNRKSYQTIKRPHDAKKK